MCGTPKAPRQAPPAPTPLPQAASDVDQAVIQARARERARNRSMFGHTKTILTGGRGLEGVQSNLARRTLLGARSDSQELTGAGNAATILAGGTPGAQTGTPAVAPPGATSNSSGGFAGGGATGFNFGSLSSYALSRGGLF